MVRWWMLCYFIVKLLGVFYSGIRLLKIHPWNTCYKTCIGIKKHFFITIRILNICHLFSNIKPQPTRRLIVLWDYLLEFARSCTYFWYKYMTHSSSLIPRFIFLVASHTFYLRQKLHTYTAFWITSVFIYCIYLSIPAYWVSRDSHNVISRVSQQVHFLCILR